MNEVIGCFYCWIDVLSCKWKWSIPETYQNISAFFSDAADTQDGQCTRTEGAVSKYVEVVAMTGR
jgi:hypothetical protein